MVGSNSSIVLFYGCSVEVSFRTLAMTSSVFFASHNVIAGGDEGDLGYELFSPYERYFRAKLTTSLNQPTS